MPDPASKNPLIPKLSGLDRELRQSASISPLANMMGAAAAMAEAGVLKGELGRKLLSKEANERETAFNQLGQLGPAGFLRELERQGIDEAKAAPFLNAKKANQELVKKLGVHNHVRRFQGSEVYDQLANELESATATDWGIKGISRTERIKAGRDTNAKVSEELRKISATDADLLTNPDRKNELRGRLGGAGGVSNAVVDAALKNFDERVKRDPDLKKFGDSRQLLDAHSPSVVMDENLMKASGVAQQAAEQANSNDGKPKAGGPLRIKIASLKINADGSGELEGDVG